VVAGDSERAEAELTTALIVFERLGSVREVERARALLAEHTPRTSLASQGDDRGR
jgi:hypothetical protein